MLDETISDLQRASRELGLQPTQELVLAEILEELEVDLWAYWNSTVKDGLKGKDMEAGG